MQRGEADKNRNRPRPYLIASPILIFRMAPSVRAMRVTELLREDDAVSPVVGVVLLVAVTLILAAVLAAFVLGVGLDQGAPPETSFDYQYDNETGNESLALRVRDGGSFDSDNVIFQFEGVNLDDDDKNTWTDAALESESFTVRPGDIVHLNDSTILDGGFQNADSVDVIWRTDDEEQSYVIYNWYGTEFDG